MASVNGGRVDKSLLFALHVFLLQLTTFHPWHNVVGLLYSKGIEMEASMSVVLLGMYCLYHSMVLGLLDMRVIELKCIHKTNISMIGTFYFIGTFC